MDTLFFPKSVCVIGASRDPTAWGHIIVKNLINGGFAGKILPINPNTDELLGIKCYASIKDIPWPIDLAIMVVPSRLVPALMQECTEKKVLYVVIISAGFRETGEQGNDLERQTMEIARKGKIRVVGPNCMGIYNAYNNMTATFTSLVPRQGGVSFISQSGAVGTTMLAWAKIEGIGFSKFISLGNEADISLPEVLGYLAEDASTTVIALYMESVRGGSFLVKSLRLASKNKPVIVMKVGTTASGVTTALSHTGALAVEDALIDGIFRQFCIIRAKDPDELFHMATSFAELPLPRGRSAAVVATGGGWAVECADLSETKGLTLSPLPDEVLEVADSLLPSYWSRKNPVDMVAIPNPEAYFKIVEAAIKASIYDMVFLVGFGTIGSIAMPIITEREAEYALKISELVHSSNKPVYIVDFLGPSLSASARAFVKNSLPVFINIRSAINAAAEMVRYQEYINRLKRQIP